MWQITFLILAFSIAVRGEHAAGLGTPLSSPTGTQFGSYSSIPLSERPCIFQAESSPSEGRSIDELKRRQPARFVKNIMGPGPLLRACLAMKTRVGQHNCSKIFLGGHWNNSGVGVGDLFYLYPNVSQTELRTARVRLNTTPSNETRQVGQRAARTSIRSGTGPCSPGPVAPEIIQPIPSRTFHTLLETVTTEPTELHLSDRYGSRWPTPSEYNTYDEILDCFQDLIDERVPHRSLVFSACGPIENSREGRDQSRYGTGPALGQEVCAKVLSNAVGIPVSYSNGECCSRDRSGQYDTCEMGHRLVTPSYWRQERLHTLR